MSWKCDVCDTYNDERELACYVCGQARSVSSIREGKIRAREERALRIENALYQKGYSILKTMFLAGLLSSLVIIVVATIIELSQGNIGNLATNFFSILEHMGSKISSTVPFNAEAILQSIMSAPVLEVGQNIEYVVSAWGSALSVIPSAAQELFISTAKNNFEGGYIGSVECLIRLSDESLSNTGAAISRLYDNAIQRISDTLHIIKSVFQNVKQYF